MNIYCAVLLLFVTAGCSTKNSAKVASVQNENTIIYNQKPDVFNNNTSTSGENTETIVVKNKKSKALDCNAPNGYKFVEIDSSSRKQYGGIVPRDMNIVVDDEIVAKIELPNAETKNFSLNSVEKTKIGFEMKVEWGGGPYEYAIQYDFRCKENDFYLYKVKTAIFSTTNPDSGNYMDKKEIKETKIEPNLPIEKFSILDYLGNK